MKVLKFEFKPELQYYNKNKSINYPYLSRMKNAIKSLKHKNLQEFHLIGVCIHMSDLNITQITSFKLFLDKIAENFPKLQRLCLTCEDGGIPMKWDEMFQAFASGKNIILEVSSVVRNAHNWNCVQFTRRKNVPIKETEVFCPQGPRW